jgi:hypothetical protein
MRWFETIVLAILVLGSAGWTLWVYEYMLPRPKEWMQINPVHPRHASTSAAARENLAVAGDDHEDEEHAYQAELAREVDAVVDGKSPLRDLPTMALPVLRDRLGDPKLSNSSQARLLSYVLATDPRLQVALNIQNRLAWYRKNVLDVFERHAMNHSWSAPGRAALEASVASWSNDPRDNGDTGMIIWREAWVADDMGCREPLLQFIRASNMEAFDWVHRNKVAQTATDAADAVNADAAEIVPFIRMEADILAAKTLATDKPVSASHKAQMDDWIAQGKSLFAKVVAEPDLPHQALLDLFDLLSQASISIYGDRRTLPSSLFDQLQKSTIDKIVVLTIQGSFNIDYAWDARGNGYANTVTPAG